MAHILTTYFNKRKDLRVIKCENKENPNDISWSFQIWGASTKHPDVVYQFSDFKKSLIVEEEYQIFQWLLECASRLELPFNAVNIAEYAFTYWQNWEKDWEYKGGEIEIREETW